jgi:hypothetical protein
MVDWSMRAFPSRIALRQICTAILAMLPLYSALGCLRNGRPIARTAGPAPSVSQVKELSVPGTVVMPNEALTVDELFDRGMHRFEQRQFSLAATDLEIAAWAVPEQVRARLAWYRAGIARDETGDFASAADDFVRVVSFRDGSVIARDAQTRLIRLLVFMERWPEAGERARSMASEFPNLRAVENIVVKGAIALAALSRADLDTAAREIEGARSIIEESQFDVAAQLQRDVAIVYFALGELRRLRASAIRFVPLPANFNDQLERRCQMVLDAQSAFSMAMRAYDAHWSVMAGYRVSELYADLHQDLMDLVTMVQWPDADRQQLFEAALRLRYSILLEKAATGLDHTLALAARTDETSKWVTWAKEALEKLRRAMADERAAIAKVPYTREQLLRALEGLKQLRSTPPSPKVQAR